MPLFQEWLEQNYNVRCTRVARRAVDDLPGLEQLDDCDVALVYFERMELRGELTRASEPLDKNEGHAADVRVLRRGSIPGGPVKDMAWVSE